jgi:hypothetical protein
VLYLYDGQRIVETRVGASPTTYHQQFIHGTQYIEELIMVRVADKGDLYVQQGERSEREQAAIGKASTDARDRPATCPQEVGTMRTTGGANWNVIGLILDSPQQAKRDCPGRS